MSTTTSPWVAWPVGADPAELASRLHVAHEQFMTGDAPEASGPAVRGKVASVRRVVLDSWLRSRRNGVDPDRPRPPVDLAGPDLAAYRRGHALAPLMPMVRRLLVDGEGSEGLLVALADASGRLLWVEGSAVVRRDIEQVGFVEGACWCEQDAGTNAPGIALATDHEVQVFAAEHFTRAVQSWSCSAAPVHDPVTGRVLGVLDLTGRDAAASPHMLALVRATVAAMESELAIRALRSRLDEAHLAGQGRAPAAADAAGDLLGWKMPAATDPVDLGVRYRLDVLGAPSGTLVRGAERQVLTLRHAELLLLLGVHPIGLTGDELAALLYPGTVSHVTVRAEMSRLRRSAGVLVGGSRPYRLAQRVPTDVDQVRDRLARGDVFGAVEAYRGPVLPRSQAPGVLTLREELAAEMRAALARTRDLDALAVWTGTAGADDWNAWQRLLVLLPAGSPTWIRARAHADVLDRELAAPGANPGATAPRRTAG